MKVWLKLAYLDYKTISKTKAPAAVRLAGAFCFLFLRLFASRSIFGLCF